MQTTPTPPPEHQRIPRDVKLAYGAASGGIGAAVFTARFFLLVFYTDVARIRPAIAASALFVAKLWDAINDPVFGWLSDRTRSRFGRRRVYLIIGAAPLAVATAWLWRTPPGLSTSDAFVWIVVSYAVFDTFDTMVTLPKFALSAELTRDYDERTNLMAYRGIGLLIGMIVGSASLPLLVRQFADARSGYAFVGALTGAAAGIGVALLAWRVRDPPIPPRPSRAVAVRLLIAAFFRNGPYVRLLMAHSLVALGLSLLMTSLPYFVTYGFAAPEKLSSIMLTVMLVVIFSVPFWKRLGQRWNKGTAYGWSLVITALALGGSYFVSAGQAGAMFAVVVFVGLGLGADALLPNSMYADVIEYDEAATGIRREGVFFGIGILVNKGVVTLGVLSVGWILDLCGYVPNAAQSAEALLGIRLIFGPIPALMMLLAAPLFLTYPVTRESHRGLRRKLSDATGVVAAPSDLS